MRLDMRRHAMRYATHDGAHDGGPIMVAGELFQWVVRDVERDLASAVVDVAKRNGRKAGEMLNSVIRIWIEAGCPVDGQPIGGDKAPGDLPELRHELAEIRARLDALEAREKPASAAKLPKAPKMPTERQNALALTQQPAKGNSRNSPIPAEHVEEADRLQAGGMSYAAIIATKGWSYHRTGLGNAVTKLRKRREGDKEGASSVGQAPQDVGSA